MFLPGAFVEKFLFSNVKVWLLLLLLLFSLLGSVMLASLAVYRLQGGEKLGSISQAALSIATFPQIVVQLSSGKLKRDDHEVDDRFPDEPGQFSFLRSLVDSPQYVLLSRYDGNISASVVELVKEGEPDVLHRWVFDDAERLAFNSNNPFILLPEQDKSYTMRIVHPWLTTDGSLFAHAHFGAMYRFGPCGSVEWVNADHMYHHSLEVDANGDLWSVGTSTIDAPELGFDETFRDNRAIRLSPNGDVTYQKSVMEILIENGLGNLVNDYDVYQRDPIHLNDVQPVLESADFSRRGDIYLSISHLNMMMLFRPETNELLWMSQDAMMQHHDVDIVGPDTIQIFDNRRKTGANGLPITLGANQILRFSLPDEKATPVFVDAMNELDVKTKNQGLADAIEGSGIMMEDTNAGRLVKLSEGGEPEWSYLNRSDDGRVWTLNWSRYIPADVGDQALENLREAECN